MRSRQTDNLGHSPGSRSRKRVSVPFQDLSAIGSASSAWANVQAIQDSSIATSALSDMATSFCRIGATYRRRLHGFSSIEHIPTAEPSRIVIKLINLVYGDYERPTENVNIIGRGSWAGKKL